MLPVKTIPDRGVVLAWSPVPSLAGVLATGVKEGGGGGFEDSYGGDLTLHGLDLAAPSQQCHALGSVKTPTRFTSLAWGLIGRGAAASCASGVIVGGMADGAVCAWDAAAVMAGALRRARAAQARAGARSAALDKEF